MSLSLKVLNGTLTDKRLCDSCIFGMVRTDSTGEDQIFCRQLAFSTLAKVETRVVKCSDYQQKNVMSKREMEDMAWLVNIKGKTVIGFKPPEKKGY